MEVEDRTPKSTHTRRDEVEQSAADLPLLPACCINVKVKM